MDISKIEIYFEWEIKVHDHLEVLWDVVTRLKTNQQLFPCVLNAKFFRKIQRVATFEWCFSFFCFRYQMGSYKNLLEFSTFSYIRQVPWNESVFISPQISLAKWYNVVLSHGVTRSLWSHRLYEEYRILGRIRGTEPTDFVQKWTFSMEKKSWTLTYVSIHTQIAKTLRTYNKPLAAEALTVRWSSNEITAMAKL